MSDRLFEHQLRAVLRDALNRAEPSELADRLKVLLSKSYDSNSTRRRAQRIEKAAIRKWASTQLVASLDDSDTPLPGHAAFEAFTRETGSKRKTARLFYTALREGGYPVEHNGQQVVLPGLELANPRPG